MNKLLGKGYKKELEIEDLFEVRKQDESEILGDRLERYFCFTNHNIAQLKLSHKFLFFQELVQRDRKI